eukprot:5464949-Amphidinium_carterae.1
MRSLAAMAKAEDLKSEIDEIQAKYTVDTGGEAIRLETLIEIELCITRHIKFHVGLEKTLP